MQAEEQIIRLALDISHWHVHAMCSGCLTQHPMCVRQQLNQPKPPHQPTYGSWVACSSLIHTHTTRSAQAGCHEHTRLLTVPVRQPSHPLGSKHTAASQQRPPPLEKPPTHQRRVGTSATQLAVHTAAMSAAFAPATTAALVCLQLLRSSVQPYPLHPLPNSLHHQPQPIPPGGQQILLVH